MMSVDRLDYSKGLVERFGRSSGCSRRRPSGAGNVSLVQIAPPTRSDVRPYQRIRQN